jgi:hypothetical protein
MEVKKDAIRRFWNEAACGTRDAWEIDESLAFLELERQRDEREPFSARFGNLEQTAGSDESPRTTAYVRQEAPRAHGGHRRNTLRPVDWLKAVLANMGPGGRAAPLGWFHLVSGTR